MTTPLTVGRPPAEPDHATALLRRRWRLDPVRVRELPSDRDRNFLAETPSGERYVLKIFNLREAPGVADLQGRALDHLVERAPELALPRVVPTVEGESVIRAEPAPAGAASREEPGDPSPEPLARLTTWVPGRPLAETRPHTEGLLEGAGALLGRLAVALEDFSHPAAHRAFPWDLRTAPSEVERRLDRISDPIRRRLLDHHLDEAASRVEPLASRLRTSVVHGDANDHNLLVTPGPEDGDGPAPPLAPAVTGLVDFGDMLRSWTAAEPAVAAAYALLGKEDPVGAAARVLSGYHAVHPLEEAELEAAHGLIIFRLLLSLAIGAEQTAEEPHNEYLAVSQEPAWEALERLSGQCPRLAHAVYRHACGLDPSPTASRVVGWLRRHGPEASPVVPEGVARRGVRPVDLWVGSRELESPALDQGTAHLEDHLLSGSDGDAPLATRWNEARAPRCGPLPFEPRTDASEPRTIHLGVEILLPAGTPLHAPFAGRVRHTVVSGDKGPDATPTLILEHRAEEAHRVDAPPFRTVYRHVDPDHLLRLRKRPGTSVARGEEVARVGGEGPGPSRLHFQLLADEVIPAGAPPATATPDRRGVWTSLSPDPNLLLRLPGLEPAEPPPSTEELLARRKRLLGPGLGVSYRRPLTIVRGWRQWLYDAEGRDYLDCVNNVPHVGHAHPRVVEALTEQAAVLNTNTRYLHQRILEYAERLTATLPDPLSVCFLVNSGSEANELALRLARAYTGARDVVVLEGGYHGNTSGLVEISPYKFRGPGGEGPPGWVHTAPMPDPYRGRHRTGGDPAAGASTEHPQAPVMSEEEAAARYVADVKEAVEAARERGGVRALFAEPILSCGGQVVPPRGFLQGACEAVREAGGLFVSDEVQVGLGRVGTATWGFELDGVVPDIVTMGKPLGNGHPLAAVVTTPQVAEAFDTGMEYFNTFGGNPVSCAVGLAVLEVMEEEGLRENARRVGQRFREGLASLARSHPVVGQARGAGLFLGLELVTDPATREPATAQAAYLKERMRERRILVSTDGPDENVIKMKPPLPFSDADADRVVETMDGILAEDPLRL